MKKQEIIARIAVTCADIVMYTVAAVAVSDLCTCVHNKLTAAVMGSKK